LEQEIDIIEALENIKKNYLKNQEFKIKKETKKEILETIEKQKNKKKYELEKTPHEIFKKIKQETIEEFTSYIFILYKKKECFLEIFNNLEAKNAYQFNLLNDVFNEKEIIENEFLTTKESL
jgi:hypothetical protein